MGLLAMVVTLSLCPWAGIEASGARVLEAAYPDFLSPSGSPNALRLRDGAEWTYDDQIPKRDYADLLARPCLKDQMSTPYPGGWPFPAPAVDQDPGRVRCEAFFKRMYGETEQDVRKNLVKAEWLDGKTVMFTRVNGASEALSRVRKELELLPREVQRYAAKPVGTFSWRTIADTERLSMHSFGAAIDLRLPRACYRFWGWDNKKEDAPLVYPEKIIEDENLRQIVCAFEKHGFIWGGKWYHYDTMHFEYRPELLPRS